MLKLYFLVVFGVLTISGAFFMNDKCTVWPTGFIEPGKVEDYQVDQTCMNGTVDWNYPRSTVRIHFQHPHTDFSVCFRDDLGGEEFGLVDVTNGRHHALPHLVRGSTKEVCIDAVRGEAVLEMQASNIQYYMGAIDYRVVMNH